MRGRIVLRFLITKFRRRAIISLPEAADMLVGQELSKNKKEFATSFSNRRGPNNRNIQAHLV